MRLFTAIVLGIILGILFAHLVFLGGFITLGTWGVAGLTIGWFGRSKKEALIDGAVFGFIISFAFLIADYNGTISIIRRLLPFAALSIVGLLGGLGLGIVGFFLKKVLKRKK